MKTKTKKQIAEAYNHFKPYLEKQEELKELCSYCEDYCGKHHNYEDCKDRICFKMYLSFAYLEWFNSF